MSNQEQLKILKQGVAVWNKWRDDHPDLTIDLRGANLKGAVLNGANLFRANLSEANLDGAKLKEANLSEAKLDETRLKRANLTGAALYVADLYKTDLRGANLTRANLVSAHLIQTKIDQAIVSGSSIYSINVWDLEGKFKEQRDLIITDRGQPVITVDNIKIAQFVYLILNNEEIRDVINTLTSKSVLILGRFSDSKRKAILNALRNKLRDYNLLPVVCDFDRPIDRNFTETVKTLASISYFVIADITSPKSTPLELQAIIPDFQIPVVPIIQEEEFPFSMINDLATQHDGLVDPLTYDSKETLIKVLKRAVIDPAIKKHNELRLIKTHGLKIRSAKDFLKKEKRWTT